MTSAESVVWSMSNHDLVEAARDLARRSHDSEAELLVHLGEIDERRLYLDYAFPSMHSFCVGELGLSDDTAYNRIHVARAGRKFPAIVDAIREGRVHLWGMRLLAPHFTEDNHQQLIARAAWKPKSEIEELIAALAPRAPAATVIRSIPARLLATETAASVQGEAPAAAGGARAEAPRPRIGPPIVPLSAQFYKIQFAASRAFHARLREAQDLMRHRVPDGNLENVFGAGLELLIEQVKKERFAVGRRGPPDASAAAAAAAAAKRASEARPSRHIPNAVKRFVYERDGGRCTFVDENGRRCEETGGLNSTMTTALCSPEPTIPPASTSSAAPTTSARQRRCSDARSWRMRARVEGARARGTMTSRAPERHPTPALRHNARSRTARCRGQAADRSRSPAGRIPITRSATPPRSATSKARILVCQKRAQLVPEQVRQTNRRPYRTRAASRSEHWRRQPQGERRSALLLLEDILPGNGRHVTLRRRSRGLLSVSRTRRTWLSLDRRGDRRFLDGGGRDGCGWRGHLDRALLEASLATAYLGERGDHLLRLWSEDDRPTGALQTIQKRAHRRFRGETRGKLDGSIAHAGFAQLP
jgi:hypothetical protein